MIRHQDATVNTPSDVKVGDWVSVMHKTDNSGHQSVTVKHSAEKQADAHNKSSEQ